MKRVDIVRSAQRQRLDDIHQCRPWRMNLTASGIADPNIFYVAVCDSVLCYRMSNNGEVKPALSFRKISSPPHPNYLRQQSAGPVPINNITTALMGTDEVVATVNDDGLVCVLFPDHPKRAPITFDNDESTWGLSIHAQSRVLAVSANSFKITLWDLGHRDDRDDDLSSPLGRGTNKRILMGHEHNIPCINFSENGKFLASCSIDGTCRIWCVSSGESLAVVGDGQEWKWHVRLLHISGFIYAAESKRVNSGHICGYVRFHAPGRREYNVSQVMAADSGTSSGSADGTTLSDDDESHLSNRSDASFSDEEQRRRIYALRGAARERDEFDASASLDSGVPVLPSRQLRLGGSISTSSNGSMLSFGTALSSIEASGDELYDLAEYNHIINDLNADMSEMDEEWIVGESNGDDGGFENEIQRETAPQTTTGREFFEQASIPISILTLGGDAFKLPGTFDSLILYSTAHSIVLLNSHTLTVATSLSNIFRQFNSRMMSFFDRIALVEYVPELSLIVAASQAGIAVVLGLYKGIDGSPEIRIETFLNQSSEPIVPLLGLFVSRHMSPEPSLTFFRLYMLGHDTRMSCFEMRRSAECNLLSIDKVA